MAQNSFCPIKPDVDKVISHSNDLKRSLRKLKRDLKLCFSCNAVTSCHLRSSFYKKVKIAIAEVQDEFDLSIS